MTIEEIIDGLRFTVSMFLFDPMTGKTKMPSDLSEDDKTTVDACMEAKKILKRYRWIPTMERMPEKNAHVLITTNNARNPIHVAKYKQIYGSHYEWVYSDGYCVDKYTKVVAWMPLPEAYKEDGHDEG